MKKILILGGLLFVITILWSSVITSVNAQNLRVDPNEIDFNYAGNFLCILFSNCSGEDGSGDLYPTLAPGEPSPTIFPSPRLMPTSNPALPKPSGTCMPPGGKISCGTRNTPINNCGHCGIGYGNPSYCRKADTGGQAEAIDITHQPLDSVPLPFLLGQTIEWTHVGDNNYKDDPAAYQDYIGVEINTSTPRTYAIRYLHTQRGSGTPLNSKTVSGTEAAKVCLNWLKYVDKCDGYKTCSCNGTRGCTAIVPGNHVHIQIYDNAVRRWVEATNFYCHSL